MFSTRWSCDCVTTGPRDAKVTVTHVKCAESGGKKSRGLITTIPLRGNMQLHGKKLNQKLNGGGRECCMSVSGCVWEYLHLPSLAINGLFILLPTFKNSLVQTAMSGKCKAGPNGHLVPSGADGTVHFLNVALSSHSPTLPATRPLRASSQFLLWASRTTAFRDGPAFREGPATWKNVQKCHRPKNLLLLMDRSTGEI